MFELMVVESNPKASEANLRYMETDLNRCFLSKDLDDPEQAKCYEQLRAREINSMIGPKTSPTPKCDYVMDLHNTTAATGVALFLHPRDKFSQELAAYLISLDSTVSVALWADRDVVVLPSVGRSGMTFEVGPVSVGCLDAKLYKQSKMLVDSALDYMAAHNAAVQKRKKRGVDGEAEEAKRKPATLQAVQMIKSVPFPRDDNKELTGMIHPSLDGKDFHASQPGDPAFYMFDGSVKSLQDVVGDISDAVVCGARGAGPDAKMPCCYPFLINETSYYEKDIAFLIGRQVTFELEVLVL
jgi:succinylglutamate desuccinylase